MDADRPLASAPLEPLPLGALPPLPPLDLAVVGHVEWVNFVGVDHLPLAGEIQRASHSQDLAAGGGAVIAVQLAKLTGQRIPFFTALGRDRIGELAAEQLQGLGLDVQVAWREAPSRRAVTFIDSSGERTITVIGERLSPTAADPLAWASLSACDGVFVTAADAAALAWSRRARFLAATPRLGLELIQASGLQLDALIGSAADPGEIYRPGDLDPAPTFYAGTEAERGGFCWPGGRFSAAALPRPVVDCYGAGDSFAAGVTAGLAAGWSRQQALSLGCHCGAACIGGRGPYANQLELGGI